MARYLAFVALYLAAWPLPAQAQPPAAETPGLGEQVRRDLDSVFQPGASLDSNVSPYQQTAARARLRTRPYATSIVGVCRRDEVIVHYGGPQPFASTPAANAVAPYGVSAEAWYRVLRDIPYAGYDGPAREGECTRLDGAETRGWFVAPDVYAAVGGYRALAAAIAQLARPRSIAGCAEDRQARQACRDALPAASLEQIAQIRRCFAPRGRFCFEVHMNEDMAMVVTIRLRYNGRGEERIESLGFDYPGLSIQSARR